MPFQIRPIAVQVAVTCFFALSIISWSKGLTPFVCCKRALLGAACAYLATALAIRAINAILIDAMAKSQLKQKEEQAGDGRN